MADSSSITRPLAAVRASAGNLTRRTRMVLSLAGRATGGALSALYAGFERAMDGRVFPAIVRFATHRLHITALLLLGVVLMVSNSSVVQFKGGNYTNITSALVACIVLLQQTAHHRENKQMHAAHAATLVTQTMAHRADMKALQRQVDALSAQVGAAGQTAQAPTSVPTPTPPTAPPTARTRRGSKAAGE